MSDQVHLTKLLCSLPLKEIRSHVDEIMNDYRLDTKEQIASALQQAIWVGYTIGLERYQQSQKS